ncbi:hypothetical protein SanaruYs_35180 [Chryseotalea sanaruensis]|uniref:Lipoprotein n=1 Tax=Chryseotalea sanaruensis TaxID=2482724 RepID=A0A401UED1_9BACT|nr:hypothetical protein [Chryseotalea sanaruensis]GCC53275.1 hypothetical protein SanaruYs_35180 [Chryseotalea sanaruensis]
MKTRIVILSLSAIMLFTACEPEADLYRNFHLKEGEHFASPRLVESLQSSRLAFYAKFDESCRYIFEETSFQDCKNKLLGFSDCNNMHHENSARFTWQWFNNQMEIYAYCYVNGERIEKFIGVVELEKENRYEIELTPDAYLFKLNDQESVSITRSATCTKGMYYMLWPYFGGTLPAPHDMHLSIKIIY